MGHGHDPAPTNDLGKGIVIDDGTSLRNESPTPGPVGMDSAAAVRARVRPASRSRSWLSRPSAWARVTVTVSASLWPAMP
jgi:hypothetical protein